ncbi:MAG: ATP-binding protein [Acidimicrobiia bacterium]
MIARDVHLRRLSWLLDHNPAVAVLGARQVGKTTLARQYAEACTGPVHHFDLESPADLARLQDPELALSSLTGLVVLDEVQRLPGVFAVLRVLIDRPGTTAQYLILGSASGALLRQTSETLAGRIAYLDLTPFTSDEVGVAHLNRLWNRGGFPRSFLAEDDGASFKWREDFTRTFLERDLPQLGITVPSQTMRRLWTMLAHSHGTTWNAAAFSKALGLSGHLVRSYLDMLTSALVVRQLQPWFENVKKRQVKSPKLYVADTGLLHTLLSLSDLDAVLAHPVAGYSWESLLIAEIAAALGAAPRDLYFWATHAGAELDLFTIQDGHRLGFEMKRTTAPRMTKSLHSALDTLRLDRAYVVHAGEHTFPMDDRVTALAATAVHETLAAS